MQATARASATLWMTLLAHARAERQLAGRRGHAFAHSNDGEAVVAAETQAGELSARRA